MVRKNLGKLTRRELDDARLSKLAKYHSIAEKYYDDFDFGRAGFLLPNIYELSEWMRTCMLTQKLRYFFYHNGKIGLTDLGFKRTTSGLEDAEECARHLNR